MFKTNLIKAFSKIESSSISLHTDMIGLKFAQPRTPIVQQFENLLGMLTEATNGRTLLFPTFNYDFLKTGIYNVEKDACQVGAFNEYVRKTHPELRTLTPTFNYCILNNKDFDFSAVNNPFGMGSIFDQMLKNNSIIAFLGASFAANTFIHYVEEMANIGYRYKKVFTGKILNENKEKIVEFIYRVRPLTENSVIYNWDKIEKDLVKRNLLQKAANINLMYFCIKDVFEFLMNKLYDDELYLLTPESQAKTKMLYSKYGKPLTYEVMEKNKE